MSAGDIFLILISGLGVLHGLFLAAFLWVYPAGNRTSNKILSLLLLVLSFRVGKSVFLEFTEDLAVEFVFTGLATLMAIGPLFYMYTQSLVNPTLRLQAKHAAHFIPAAAGLLFGVWLNEHVARSLPKAVFILMFATYYAHYLLYLFASYLRMHEARKAQLPAASLALLRLVFYALLALWFVYVLNLFDDAIPYIVGPILYSLVAYSISLIIIKKGYIKAAGHTKYKTTPVSGEQIDQLFASVLKAVVEEKQFKNGDLTLKSLSEQLNVTPQALSMVINKQGKANFNSFINQHRIAESLKMFRSGQYEHFTVAAIAYEVGFNSISSFNQAFKSQTGHTPVEFRKRLAK